MYNRQTELKYMNETKHKDNNKGKEAIINESKAYMHHDEIDKQKKRTKVNIKWIKRITHGTLRKKIINDQEWGVNEDRTVLSQILPSSLSFCFSFSVPIAMRDRAASTPVRIVPSPLLAIIVRSATSIARHVVLFESIVSNVTTSSSKLTTVCLWIH